MRIFDPPRETFVPAGLGPRMLVEVFIDKMVRSGLALSLTLVIEGTETEFALLQKITETVQMLRAMLDECEDWEIAGELQENVDVVLAQTAEVRAERGMDWNPEFTTALPADEFIDGFLYLCAGDFQNMIDRIHTDEMEEAL